MASMLKVVSDAMLAELKECFLEAYDDNQDGKIDIREVRRDDTYPLEIMGPNSNEQKILPKSCPKS